jgi:hypothetical protein
MAAPHDDSAERPAGRTLGGDIATHVEAIVRAAEREAHAAERAIEARRRAAEEEVQRYLAAARLHADAEAAARAARLSTLSASARRLAEQLSDATDALSQELRRSDEDVAAALPRTPWPPPAERAPTAEPATAQAVRPAQAPAATEPERPAQAPAAAETERPAQAPAAAETERPAQAPAAQTTAPEPTWQRATPERPAAPASPDGPPIQPSAIEIPSAARLVAIEMAVGGSPRADVERHLREQLGVEDADELLDDVFGPASHAASRLAWGEP